MNYDEKLLKVLRWSTADVDARRRIDYYVDATSAAMIPLSIACEAKTLDAAVEHAELGPLEIFRLRGTPHKVFHGLKDIARARARRYYLMTNITASWGVAHCGNMLLAPGEMVLLDSELPYTLHLNSYEIVTVAMSSDWIQNWVHRPELLLGKRIAGHSLSGRALSSLLPLMTPVFAADPPLSSDFMAGQIGALLAGLEAEVRGHPRQFGAAMEELLRQTPATHRTLAASRMLESRMFKMVGAREIAARAGFSDVNDMFAALEEAGRNTKRPEF